MFRGLGVLVLVLLLGAALAPLASAAPGDLDTSFGSGGVYTGPAGVAQSSESEVIARDAQGNILLASQLQPDLNQPPNGTRITRLTSAGAPDPTFGTNGSVTIDGGPGQTDVLARAIAPGPDGTIVVAGEALDAGGYNDTFVDRLTSSGAYDDTFSGDGRLTTTVESGAGAHAIAKSLIVNDDGSVLIGGEAQTVDDQGRSTSAAGFVAKLTSDGSLDPGFGGGDGHVEFHVGGVDDSQGVNEIASAANGRILAAEASNAPESAIWAITAAGAIDPSFNGGSPVETKTIDLAQSLAVDGDGRILLGGYSDQPGENGNPAAGIARFTSDGAVDTSFGTSGRATISASTGVEGVVAVCGDLPLFNGGGVTARLTSAGALDSSYGGGGGVSPNGGNGFHLILDGSRALVPGFAATADGSARVPTVTAVADVSTCPSGPSTFQMTAATATVGEGDGHVTITVTRSGDTSQAGTVGYATADGSAMAPADYAATSGTLSFAAGQTSADITVPIVDDATQEGDETFSVSLSGPSAGATLGSPSSTTVTIVDNDQTTTGTTITSGPSGPTNEPDPPISFGGGPPGATYHCAVDNGTPTACSSPYQPGTLADGDHTVTIITTVPSSGTGSGATSSVSRTFTVDTVAPTASLQLSPAEGGTALGNGNFTRVVFAAATVTDPAPATGVQQIRCVVDPPSPPRSFDDIPQSGCLDRDGHPWVYVSGIGTHTFYVAGRDNAGNEGAVYPVTFQIVPEPDTSIAGSPGEGQSTWNEDPSFTLTSTVPGSHFVCSFDQRPEQPCTSPTAFPAILSPGSHSFTARAVAPTGAQDLTPAHESFTVTASATANESCQIDPLVYVEPGYSGSAYPQSCRIQFGSPQACPAAQRCVRRPETCPRYAVCTLRTTVRWDTNLGYAARMYANSRLEPTSPPLSVDGGYTHLCGSYSSCTASDSEQAFGPANSMTAACDAFLEFPPQPPHDLPPIYRGSAQTAEKLVRVFTCTAELTIVPATPTRLAASRTSFVVFVPSAGTLRIDPATLLGLGARRTKPPKKKPAPFRAVTRTTHGPGVVAVAPALSKAAKQTLARRHRLTVTATVRFTPAGGGTPIRKVQTVTLTQPPHRPPCRGLKISKGQKITACLPRSAKRS